MTKEQKHELTKLIISAALFIAALITDKTILNDDISFVLRLAIYIPAYMVAGFDVLKNAVLNILHGEIFDENFLMAVAGIGAFCVGEYPEAVIIMLFYGIGELFEDVAVENSRSSISQLIELAPKTANVCRNNEIINVNVKEIKCGELIIVKAGEKVPLDGVLENGNSAFDMSALTGEAMPVSLREGDNVLSASINMQNAVYIRVEKEYKDSTATIIQETVENAVAQKPKVDKFITKFAKYYTPFVVLSAAVVALIVPLLTGYDFAEWIHKGLMLLVISCPCALVISVPLGFFIGIGNAAKNGVLIKGCNTIELLKNASVAVFDKTGTITKGNFSVSYIYSDGYSEEKLKSIALSLERYSNHPIAKAICTEFAEKQLIDVVDACEIPGKGITAQKDGKVLLAGNKELLADNGIEIVEPFLPGTTVHIAVDGAYCGYIVVSDELKDNAKATIAQLKQLGIKNTVMLTGDNSATARDIAQRVGIDTVRARLLPQQKSEVIEALMIQKHKNETLIFTGDGINDAPSIIAADVGIAMGKTGTDLAIEVADVVIMDDKLQKIPYLIALSKKTMSIIMQNIVFALLIKAAIFLLSIIGISNMWFAIFADVGTLVLAILNTMRINKI